MNPILLNGLGFTGRTLHMYSEYFSDKPLDRLIAPSIKAAHINDDALGRCLDALYEYGVFTFVPKYWRGRCQTSGLAMSICSPRFNMLPL